MGTEQRTSANSIRKPSSAPWCGSFCSSNFRNGLFVCTSALFSAPQNPRHQTHAHEKSHTKENFKYRMKAFNVGIGRASVLNTREPNSCSQDCFLGNSRDQKQKLVPRYDNISRKYVINTSSLTNRLKYL